MKTLLPALTALALCLPAMGQAQSFSGAELDVSLLASSGSNRLGYTSYSGGVEFQSFGAFGVAADFSFNGFRAIDSDAKNFTLHGFYDSGYGYVGGLYLGFENGDAFDGTIIGFEGKAELSTASVEGFLGFTDDKTRGDVTLFGIDGAYDFASTVKITGSFGYAKDDLDTVKRFAVGGEYGFNVGPVLYGEIGRINADRSSNYIEIGAHVAIGDKPGTTFGRRGILDAVRSY